MGSSVLVGQAVNRCINLRQVLDCSVLRMPRQTLLSVQKSDDQTLPYYAAPHV